MILSIWMILTVIIIIAFWFFYKRNKFKLKKPIVKLTKKQSTYSLTDIDKMLDNITQKEDPQKEFANEKDVVLKETESNTSKVFSKKQKKQEFDFKSGIITSILLNKKEDL